MESNESVTFGCFGSGGKVGQSQLPKQPTRRWFASSASPHDTTSTAEVEIAEEVR
jgi:hypothetical protein